MDKARILIVEDEVIVAKNLEHQLKAASYMVTGIAASFEQALHLAEKELPDLVLMDIRLKGKRDGIAAADAIRKRWDIPVVFLTAFADEPTLQRAMGSEPLGYLLKPFEERMLHTTIEMALSKHSLNRQLRLERDNLNNIFASLPDGLFIIDPGMNITYANDALVERYGPYEGMKCHDYFNGLDEPCNGCACDTAFQGRGRERWEFFSEKSGATYDVVGIRIQQADGSTRSVQVLRDVSERLSLEKAVVNIKEAEQRKLGMELHDGLNHFLLGTALKCRSLVQELQEKAPTVAEQATQIENDINNAMEIVRNISHGLFPVNLENAGLDMILEEFKQELENKYAMQCELHIDQKIILSDLMKNTQIYYILKEAIQNVIKHAHATKVFISLTGDNSSIVLRIRDNGKSRAIPTQVPGGGMGIKVMEYRARLIGGSLQTSHSPGKGTEVVCRLRNE